MLPPVSRKRLEGLPILVVGVAFGLWGGDLLPGWVMTPILVVGGLVLLVDFARWLDRNAY
jgi:hypothetical protein